MTLMEQVANPTAWADIAGRDKNAPAGATRAAQRPNEDAGMLARNRRSALLNRIVEAEILPRLALARTGTSSRAAEQKPSPVTTEADTAELVRLLMGRDDGGACAFIERLEQQGVTPASLYLGIVSRAARRLGELWEEDRCDFARVTICLGRLQQVIRSLSPSFQRAAVNRSPYADTVLLLPAPGEQHTLGLIMLSEFFLREGWHLIGGSVSTGYDAADLVRGTWVDVAGFSIGSISHLDQLKACIRVVRKASRNRYIGVMVGGPLLLQRPDLVTRLGADATASDAASAIRQAKGLLTMRSFAAE
jgi:MerR family transcriptional regulator, light-induced transcriptional regulator